MELKVITWNLRRAKQDSPAWAIIADLNPDLIILQEVISIPGEIKKRYSHIAEKAISKSGKHQIFSSAILVKGKINKKLRLSAEYDWVNKEIEFFSGNLLGCEVEIENVPNINVISVYSPAWPIERERLQNIDISPIKLKHNPELWCTEILWAILKNEPNLKNEDWIVAGDFNSSVTFDHLWGNEPRGNQEIIDRMNSIGLTECLKSYMGKLRPTFRNSKGGKIIHQLDHMYVTKMLHSSMTRSRVGDSNKIFENSVSDHLPIITDFKIKTST